MMYRFFLVLTAATLLSTTAYGAEWEYLQNDNLEFAAGEQELYTTGDTLGDEWLAVRLTNGGDEPFEATHVHFITASALTTQHGGTFCDLCSRGTSPRDRMMFELKVWADTSDAGAGSDYEPGIVLSSFISEDSDSSAAVNAIAEVGLSPTVTVNPGQSVRVGIRFMDGGDVCTGQIVQDQAPFTLGTINLLKGRLVPCTEVCTADACALGMSAPCVDNDLIWRDLNRMCVVGEDSFGTRGDLAIRLSRQDRGITGPGDTITGSDTGPRDTGAPDVGTPDAAADVVVAPPLTINRISPSMGPTNLDLDLQIFGTGFAEGITVRIGPANLEMLSVINDTELTATLRGGSLQPGTYDAIAMLGTEEFTHRSGFQVTDAEYEAPSIASIDPNAAQEGAALDVTISGANFRDDADVLFGGRSGTNVVISNEGATLVVTAPNTLQAGVYDVEVENEDGQSDIIRGGWQVTALDVATPDEGCCAVAGEQALQGKAGLWMLALVGLALARRQRQV